MKLKLNYLVIPLGILLVSVLGSSVTGGNMDWYKTLNLPSIAPPGGFIGTVWTVIFILSAISLVLFWNKEKNKKIKQSIAGLFILNGLLNIFWSVVFFGWHLLGWAIVEMIVLNLLNLIIIIGLWRNKHKVASVLLWPYFAWVSFATYLAYSIWSINR
jgi:tryptophan-rich sensory protein